MLQSVTISYKEAIKRFKINYPEDIESQFVDHMIHFMYFKSVFLNLMVVIQFWVMNNFFGLLEN